jgi:hypothetical protein
MCKKIAVSENKWEDLEVAVNKMKLFEKKVLPQLTHGICHACDHTVREEIDKISNHG